MDRVGRLQLAVIVRRAAMHHGVAASSSEMATGRGGSRNIEIFVEKGCGGSRQTYPMARGGFQKASDDNDFAPIFDVNGSSLRHQETTGKLHREVLVLLLVFNCGEQRRICLHMVMARF
jgi:hypothetical protein